MVTLISPAAPRAIVLATTLALLLGTAGCSRPGRTYAMAPAAIAGALVDSRIPTMGIGGMFESAPAQVHGADVSWLITNPTEAPAAGSPVPDHGLILVAHVEADGQGSRITTDLRPANDADARGFADRKDRMGATRGVLDAIIYEQVDATLAHRTFNPDQINTALIRALPDILPLIREQADKAAAASEQRDRETVDRAYDQHNHAAGSNLAAAPVDDTRPIDDTRPNQEN